MKLKLKLFACLFGTLFSVHLSAAILGEKEAETADLALLISEATSFRSIGMSIALSIARCNSIELYLCPLTVKEGEIRELIKVLDARINNLVLRQEQEQIEDTENFNKLLTVYINQRYSYNVYLEKLSRLNALKLFEDEELTDDEDVSGVSATEDSDTLLR